MKHLLCSFAELSINQVNVEEEGITFPTKNDNSNITENPATFLELPKQTSKTNTGRTVMLSVGNLTRTQLFLLKVHYLTL